MKIKTIYFDLGNVILFFSMPKMFAQIGNCTGMSPEEAKKLLFDTPLRKQYETGKIDTEGLYQAFQKHGSRSFTIEEFVYSFCNIFTLNQELCPIIENLKRAGIRLILLSNTSESHFNYAYSHYPILHLFDHKVLSFKIGSWKPESYIFQEALTHSHCLPEECLYFDDIPEFIASAEREGLNGKVFIDVATLKKQLLSSGVTFL